MPPTIPDSHVPELFPSSDERERIDNWLTVALSRARARGLQGRVAPAEDIKARLAPLAAFDFAEKRQLKALLPWVLEQMEHGIVHVDHPRYFGLFNPAPTFPAQCADRITASFNPQLATAVTSPFPVAIEACVIRAIADRAGLPAGSAGHFTSGGSEANYTALICALTRANEEFALRGARGFSGQPVFYTSQDAHLAWLKIAHQAGIGRDAVRLVATDGCGRMNPAALADTISNDIANEHVPIMIAATAGTTNAGMIDPLSDCAEIAHRHQLWYHVDAAWGGALIVSDQLRSVLAGIEAADSVTIDAHKWFATTMGCGMFFTAHPSVLSASFQVIMTCMPSNLPDQDPYVTTAQWSRRFNGLRLFLALASAGWGGYAKHVERSVGLADLIRDRLTSRGWTHANNSPLAVVCLAPPADAPDARSIAKKVVDSGAAWISATEFERNSVIRACAVNSEATDQDIELLIDSLNKAIGRA
jgi:glutamate/tyrosine decarboxylase-like PLP-dependent enzyme